MTQGGHCGNAAEEQNLVFARKFEPLAPGGNDQAENGADDDRATHLPK